MEVLNLNGTQLTFESETVDVKSVSLYVIGTLEWIEGLGAVSWERSHEGMGSYSELRELRHVSRQPSKAFSFPIHK